MFSTISHTFGLMKTSWRVLMQDRELILFPILSGITLLLVLLVFAGIASVTGTLAHFAAIEGARTATSVLTPIDYVVSFVFLVTAYAVAITFNAALIASALERLRGGNPTVGTGLRAASAHLPAILGWAVIAATVGLVLGMLRDKAGNNLFARIAISLVGGVWAYITFFVVPVLVVEGLGPIEAIKRSGSLFRSTWGNQAAAGFGFGLVYLGAMLLAFLPAAALYAVAPLLGVVAGVLTMSRAFAVVMALEGIFKAALYQFARGETAGAFEADTLRAAYRAL